MSAVISESGLYRYYLARHIQPGLLTPPRTKPILFIGVNPSTADAEADDATIRKMLGFASAWGYSDLRVVNVFAYRATDVKELAAVSDPRGKHNQHYIESALDECELVVPCWGNVSKVPRTLWQWFTITRIAIGLSDKPVNVFGLTKTGDPIHPLMLPYSTKLQGWKP